MKRFTLMCALGAILIAGGCAQKQITQLQADEQTAEKVLAATTQATAMAQAAFDSAPASAPGRAAIVSELTAAQKVENDAKLALNLAQAALNAAQKKDATDPALGTAISAALAAIPSPWTAVLASLIPAAIPLIVSVVQSVKLGRAHQTVQTVTQELEQHKAALTALAATSATKT
jgi:hypothetical protein